jgi:hypothetical protein
MVSVRGKHEETDLIATDDLHCEWAHISHTGFDKLSSADSIARRLSPMQKRF